MSVLSINPLGERTAFFGLITTWKATRRWLVKCDTRFQEEWQILETGWNFNGTQIFPIPYTNVLGSQPMLLCRSLQADQQRQNPQVWIVTAEYSSEPLSQQQKDAQQFENPLERPSKIRWGSGKYNKAAVFDSSGNSITNSAGDPFDPPPEIDQSRWTATVTTNVSAVPQAIIDYTDAVNSDGFTILSVPVSPLCAKIMGIDVSEEQTAQVGENDFVNYFVFGYVLEFRKETWKLQLLDQGFREFDPNDATKRIPIKDDAVPPKDVTKPWPLDGAGTRLNNPTPDTAAIVAFDVYNSLPFGGVLPGLNS